jgi:hypothetical protein
MEAMAGLVKGLLASETKSQENVMYNGGKPKTSVNRESGIVWM